MCVCDSYVMDHVEWGGWGRGEGMMMVLSVCQRSVVECVEKHGENNVRGEVMSEI